MATPPFEGFFLVFSSSTLLRPYDDTYPSFRGVLFGFQPRYAPTTTPTPLFEGFFSVRLTPPYDDAYPSFRGVFIFLFSATLRPYDDAYPSF